MLQEDDIPKAELTRDQPITEIIPWMRQQWSQNAKKLTSVDGHEISINEFIEIMLKSGQFNSK